MLKSSKSKYYLLLAISLVVLFFDIVLGQLGYATASFIFTCLGVVSWFSLLFYANKYYNEYKPSVYDLLLGIIDIVVGLILLFELLVGIDLVAELLLGSLFAVRMIKVSRFSKTALKGYAMARGGSYAFNILKTDIKRRFKLSMNANKLEVVKTEKLSKLGWVEIIAIVLGVGYSILTCFMPEVALFGDQVISMLVGCGVAGISGFMGVFTKAAKLTDEQIAKAKEANAKKAAAELAKIEESKKKEAEAVAKLTAIAGTQTN